MRKLTFTVYPRARQTNPIGVPHTRTLEEWWHSFEVREVREAKEGTCIVLVHIPEGKKRGAANVRAAHAIAIDIDKDPKTEQPWPEERIEAAFDALEPYEYFVWTTHSHTAAEPRMRIVVPFAEPIDPSDYPAAWGGLNALIGGINDPQTKDISRLHYLPSCPPGRESQATAWAHPGRWITFDELPDTAITPVSTPTVEAEDPAAIERLVFSLRNKMKFAKNYDPAKPLLLSLLNGWVLAEAGGRHKAIIGLTWWLAEKSLDIPVAALAELFSPSLTTMRQDSPGDSPTLEEVVDAFAGARRKIIEGKQKAEDQKQAELNKKARTSQLDLVGGAPYDKEDLKRIASVRGWDEAELGDKWIIAREGMYWMLNIAGHYQGPFCREDTPTAMSSILGRAPVRLMEASRNGLKYRPLADVFRESGQVAHSVLSDLVIQHTWFDIETKIIHEAVRPLRSLKVIFHEQINEWLKLLAGPLYNRLIDWLSCVPDLSKLLCAVYFDGEPGSGKTLMATGLARLWTQGPPGEIELALSGYNDEIARCPMLLADEEIPKKYGSVTATTALRSMLSTTQRALKRKYKGPSELIGAVRLVLAANNEFLLDSKDVSSKQDLDAIAQRFLYIRVTKDASNFLNELPRSLREMWADKGIAEHALWLRENHVVKEPGKRFWVEGDVSQMHRLLMTGSKWNSLVCEWLCRYLMEPNLFDKGDSGLVRRGNGELLVNIQALLDGWGLYHKAINIDPETAKIGAALRALSKTPKPKQLRNKGLRTRYRIIDIDHVLAWSDRYNVGDREDLLKKIGDDSATVATDMDAPYEEFESVPTINDEEAPF
jgi:hypothetical protein